MIRGSYLLLTLSWHSETSNCESKYSLHQENLPIMMGAGHYCDQLSHRSGKWDVINVAVNNNIRIYCGKITTAIEVKLDIKSCRETPGTSPFLVSCLVVVVLWSIGDLCYILGHIPGEKSGQSFLASEPRAGLVSSHLIIFSRLGLLSEQRRFSVARHFCIFYLYLFSYQYL